VTAPLVADATPLMNDRSFSIALGEIKHTASAHLMLSVVKLYLRIILTASSIFLVRSIETML
jgi:hypothetical protein